MSQAADRNLLWGVLALQMDFISRDALVDAMTAWTVAKHRGLDEILVERGDLDPIDRDVLRPMLHRHIARHGGDPAQSLAAIGGIGPAREAVAKVDDPDVQASLAHVATHGGMAEASASVDDHDITVYNPDDPINAPPSIRFRRLRPHARGNLGEVFVARDNELHREVALKEIREMHADRADSRLRFLVEAEITGGLEHPGIVPVYGLGCYPDGRPFYAMRFIKGESLAQAIDRFQGEGRASGDEGERSLGLRKLLGRFLDVCNAIAYAHSRGVLHRDIKPANIMVGKYGETLVVDWGLARTLDDPSLDPNLDEPALSPASGSGVTGTVAGTAIGTPAYMPPEQANGRLDVIGPASDVYSLGATLYQVLTGKAPFGPGELGEILGKVVEGDFPPPGARSTGVPKGLEAICLKAMARKPVDRYQSALALAADVDHWLADEPVSARPDRPVDRLARWSRRHRAATLATAAAMLSLTLAATTAAVLIAGAQRETRRALVAETGANERMGVVFRQARKTVQDLVALIRDDRGLRETPALRPFRESILRRALAYSRGFVEGSEAEPVLKADVASALHEVASITAEIGQTADAERAYVEAIARFEALAAGHPEDSKPQDGLAKSCNNLGMLQEQTGRIAEAAKTYGRAIEIYERLLAGHPEADDYKEGLAKASNNLGLLQRSTGQTADAERNFARSASIRERLLSDHPESDAFKEGVAETLSNLGSLQHSVGRTIEAGRNLSRTVELYGRLAADRPAVDVYREGLAMAFINLGSLQQDIGGTPDALKSDTRAVELYERLSVERPEVDAYREGLAKACNNLGSLQGRTGRAADASGTLARTVELYERLSSDRPKVDAYRDGLGMALTNLGGVQARTGRAEDAARSFARTIALYERLSSDRPQIDSYREGLAKACNNLGNLQARMGRLDDAIRNHSRMIELYGRLSTDRPEVDAYREGLGLGFNNLGGELNGVSQLQDAGRNFAQAVEVYERLASDRPDVGSFRHGLAMALTNLGTLQQATGRPEEGVKSLARTIEIYERLSTDSPEVEGYREGLAKACNNLGNLHYNANRPAEADRSYARAFELCERLVKDRPEVDAYRDLLAMACTNLGGLRAEADKFEEATRYFVRAVEVRERLLSEHADQPRYRSNLGVTLENYAALPKRAGRPDEARRLLLDAIGHQSKALLAEPKNATYHQFLNNHYRILFRLEYAQDRPEAAVSAVKGRRALWPGNPDELYLSACEFSACISLKAASPADRSRYADLAVESLNQAVAAGWLDADRLSKESDLAPLRDRADFKALLASIKDRPRAPGLK